MHNGAGGVQLQTTGSNRRYQRLALVVAAAVIDSHGRVRVTGSDMAAAVQHDSMVACRSGHLLLRSIPMSSAFTSLDAYPTREDACGVLMRLVDGLGYRFHWATEGLGPDDYAFSPGAGCMTIGELVKHVWGLANWVHGIMRAEGAPPERPEDAGELREQALELLLSLRRRLEAMSPGELFGIAIKDVPVWHVINGPLSDALTHVGQINTLRRLNGKPAPAHNVFMGK
jgi:hypothetical protein